MREQLQVEAYTSCSLEAIQNQKWLYESIQRKTNRYFSRKKDRTDVQKLGASVLSNFFKNAGLRSAPPDHKQQKSDSSRIH
jgi:hypothetical protein